MTLAKLIQNQNSTNKFYIPQNSFPYASASASGNTVVFRLNEDGTINIQPDRAGTSSTYYFPSVSASVLSSFTNNPLASLFVGVDEELLDSRLYFHPRIVIGYYTFDGDYELKYYSTGSYAGGRIIYYKLEPQYEEQARYELSNGKSLLLCPILQPNGSSVNNAHLSLCIGTTPPSSWESAYTIVPTYTVTYRDPSGTNANVTHSNIDEGSATPAAPAWTRTGYALTGWNPARASTVTSNVTYSAVWTANTYQIQWVDPSGTNVTVTNSATYGSTTPTPPTWTRDGYEFGSWIPSVSSTVTKTQQYMAQWATAGSGKLPVTLDLMRVWADANGYPAGTTIADADRMVLTYEQLAELAGGTGDPMAADGKEYVTLEQLREWANSVASTSLSLIEFNSYVSDSREKFTYDGGTVTVPAGGIKFYLPETLLDITEIGTVAIPPTSDQRIIIANAASPETKSARASPGENNILINADGTVVLNGALGGNVYVGWYENRDEFTYTAQ